MPGFKYSSSWEIYMSFRPEQSECDLPFGEARARVLVRREAKWSQVGLNPSFQTVHGQPEVLLPDRVNL
ncbi:hypothetical protein AC579_6627 [Pseudocercospora musae]|uniref:Uncharacterized protein n=1 Tax=Pseudocercospora musae TaxID=113226 RepID=A0A139I7F3_9PEZI|nr:hypothetical protein AC579_6627 [Pseudocercospora musae]